MKLESVKRISNICFVPIWKTRFKYCRPDTWDRPTRSSTEERKEEERYETTKTKPHVFSTHQALSCSLSPSSSLSEPLSSDTPFSLALRSRESKERLEMRSGTRRSSWGAGLRLWDGVLRKSSCKKTFLVFLFSFEVCYNNWLWGAIMASFVRLFPKTRWIYSCSIKNVIA